MRIFTVKGFRFDSPSGEKKKEKKREGSFGGGDRSGFEFPATAAAAAH
jgi:hypothetical protein